MKLKTLAARLTGFSIPIFGVSWNPPEPQRNKVRRVVTFLEDRRVLFAPYSWEVPDHCAASVLEIRRFLTDELAAPDTSTELAANLRAMRAACRKFLNAIGITGSGPKRRSSALQLRSPDFLTALGELRAIFGLHLASLAVQYGVELEEELSAILPGAPTKSDA